MQKQVYYIVECDNAPQPDKYFSLKDVRELLIYIEQLDWDYEVYLYEWDEQESNVDSKINVTSHF
jgi:hypothetical protein